MQILVVNPNTTSSMTAAIGKAARRVASHGVDILAINPSTGPASIQGYYDEAMSLSGLLSLIHEHSDVDGVVIACFDDTGLDAARCIIDCPVIGIGEAAYHMASMISNHFSVVTTLSRSVPALQHNLQRYGLASRCVSVRASDVPVLELENEHGDARKRIGDEIEKAITQDKAEAIVLGCAGMTDLAADFQNTYQVPVLDGVVCAVKLCESMASLGLKTSRLGGYASAFT